jgi:hypothetical protein
VVSLCPEPAGIVSVLRPVGALVAAAWLENRGVGSGVFSVCNWSPIAVADLCGRHICTDSRAPHVARLRPGLGLHINFDPQYYSASVGSFIRSSAKMPRGVAKENLPSKMCAVCKRPFTWRKVWEKCWDEVQTCSDRCKSERKRLKQLANKGRKEPSAEQQQQQPALPADG